MMNNVFYIAFRTEAREDWKSHIDGPKKPGGWKEETFQAKLPELWQKKVEGAPAHFSAGKIVEIGAQEHNGAVKLFDTISSFIDFMEGIHAICTNGITLVGIGVKDSLRHCGWNLIVDDEEAITPAWLWGSTLETGITVIDVATLAGIGTTVSKQLWYVEWLLSPAADIKVQLKNVERIARKMSLVGVL